MLRRLRDRALPEGLRLLSDCPRSPPATVDLMRRSTDLERLRGVLDESLVVLDETDSSLPREEEGGKLPPPWRPRPGAGEPSAAPAKRSREDLDLRDVLETADLRDELELEVADLCEPIDVDRRRSCGLLLLPRPRPLATGGLLLPRPLLVALLCPLCPGAPERLRDLRRLSLRSSRTYGRRRWP